VMMYVRFPLSLRNVEDLLVERGIDISHETVRFWWNRFGPMFAAEIRRERATQRFRSQKTLQKFSSVHAQVHNQFNQEHHLVTRQVDKQRRSAALAESRHRSPLARWRSRRCYFDTASRTYSSPSTRPRWRGRSSGWSTRPLASARFPFDPSQDGAEVVNAVAPTGCAGKCIATSIWRSCSALAWSDNVFSDRRPARKMASADCYLRRRFNLRDPCPPTRVRRDDLRRLLPLWKRPGCQTTQTPIPGDIRRRRRRARFRVALSRTRAHPQRRRDHGRNCRLARGEADCPRLAVARLYKLHISLNHAA
jgi:hypothetical protein